MSYPVIKWVKGNPYLYIQESYRVKGAVRTRTVQYLGRANAVDVVRVLTGKSDVQALQGSDGQLGDGMAFDGRFTSQAPLSSSEELSVQERYEWENPPTPEYAGADSLTLAILEELEGRQFVSRQFIADLARMPGLKPFEKELIEGVLESFSEKRLPVELFGARLENELLPLEPNDVVPRWSDFQLPDDFQDWDLAYSEHLYAAPFQTAHGAVHFDGSDGSENYFAHVRAQDGNDGTRRILELQSDLFQRYRRAQDFEVKDVEHGPLKGRNQEDFDRLSAYRKTWWQRVLKEEFRRAANDGCSTLQFPTGETSAYIEGFASPVGDDRLSEADLYPGNTAQAEGLEVTVLSVDGMSAQVIESDLIERRYDWDELRRNEIDYIATEMVADDPKSFGWEKPDPPKIDDLTEMAERYFDEEWPTAQDWADHASCSFDRPTVVIDDAASPELVEVSQGYSFWQEVSEVPAYDPYALDDGQRRVVSFYERDLPAYLKKLGREALRERDEYGIEWYSVSINAEDAKAVRAL